MAAHVALWVCAAVAIAVIAYAAHEHTKQKNRSPALSTSARTRPSTHTTPIPMESFTKEGPVARPSSDAAATFEGEHGQTQLVAPSSSLRLRSSMQPNHRGPLVQQHQVPAADCGPNVVYRHYLAPPRHLMDEVRVSWHQTAFEPIDLLSHLIQDAIRGGHVSGIIICSPGTAVRLGMVCIAPALIQAFHRMLDFAYDATYPRCILCSWPWWSRGCYPHQPVLPCARCAQNLAGNPGPCVEVCLSCNRLSSVAGCTVEVYEY